MQAFLAQDVLKQDMITRVRTHAPDMRDSNILYWRDGRASAAGAALGSDDQERWQADFGLPEWLAVAIDVLAMTASSADEGWQAAAEVLEAIPAGASLDANAYDLVAGCLAGKPGALIDMSDDEDVRQCARSLSSLHRRASSGEAVEPSQWRAIRREIDQLCPDKGAEGARAFHVQCLEAAAWDPLVSRTTVAETLRTWMRAVAQRHQYPWTQADHDRIKARLDELYQAAKAEGTENKINVFVLLEEQSPEMAEEIKQHNRTDKQAFETAWRAMRDRFVDAMSS